MENYFFYMLLYVKKETEYRHVLVYSKETKDT